ncbi:hypothetical protein N8568_01515 [bacterium]|nr:hypothetical protein [bacterium]
MLRASGARRRGIRSGRFSEVVFEACFGGFEFGDGLHGAFFSLAGVVAGRFYFADFASDGGELGLAVAEVDLGGVNFFENLEGGRLVICGDG